MASAFLSALNHATAADALGLGASLVALGRAPPGAARSQALVASDLGTKRELPRLSLEIPAPTARKLGLLQPVLPEHTDGRRTLLEPPISTAFLPLEAPCQRKALHLALTRLLDPHLPVQLPPPQELAALAPLPLENQEMDKLVAALGRSRATWRRALVLHEWLLAAGHTPDDRLCTTLIRVCSQHGQAGLALNLYDWMRRRPEEGGAGLRPTVYTYTAAMRAALAGNLTDRALQVWDDAVAARCETDGRMHTALIEVCTRTGDTGRALAVYEALRDAPPRSRLAPSIHAFTAAMRAAAEGGYWQRALEIWADMQLAGCKPTGHTFAAAISACAVGGAWQRAVQFFDQMLETHIKPDVVSCTALWERAERVMAWMLANGVKPNVRTYTALLQALGKAGQWARALDTLSRMRSPASAAGHVEPNAYTYSALLKTMGEQGQWQLAEEVFAGLEAEALRHDAAAAGDEPAPPPQAALALPPAPPSWGGPVSAPDSGNSSPAEQPHARSPAKPVPGSPAGASSRAASPGVAALGSQRDSAGSFGEVPTALAEQVLADAARPAELPSGSASSASTDFGLPDDLPGLASPAHSPRGPYDPVGVFFDPAVPGCAAAGGVAPPPPPPPPPAKLKATRAAPPKGPLNEVVCATMMSAYLRAGLYEKALGVLDRAARLRLQASCQMVNMALTALSKLGNVAAAKELFNSLERPDALSYETLISCCGEAGLPHDAEALLAREIAAGFQPKTLAFLGVIAGWSAVGDWRRALLVKNRVPAGCQSAALYNALLGVTVRAQQWDQGLALSQELQRKGVPPDAETRALLEAVGRGGYASVGHLQGVSCVLATTLAAAGTAAIQSGLF